MVENLQLSLSPELINKICPFYVMIDSKGVIQCTGQSFNKVFKQVVWGTNIKKWFNVIRSTGSKSYPIGADQFVILEEKSSGNKLKAQVLQLSTDYFLHIGYPVIDPNKSILDYGLSFSDFANNDSLIEYLFLYDGVRNFINEEKSLLSNINLKDVQIAAIEKRLDKTLQIASMGVWFHNRGDIQSSMSSKCKEIIGIGEDELINYPSAFYKIVHPEDSIKCGMIFDQVFTKGVSAHFECRIISHKRQVVYTEQSIISTVDDKGKFVGAQGLIRDITDKKVAEILRNKAESVTLALLENLKEAVVVIDANSKITFVSKALENVLGYTAEELVGKPSIKLTTDEDQPRVAAMFKEMAEGGTGHSVSDIFYIQRPDQKWIWADFNITNQFDNPLFNGYITSVRDITNLREAQDKIEQYNSILEIQVSEKTQELTQKNEDLERFVYSVSHDLRSPLRTVSSYASLLERIIGNPEELDEAKEMLATIKSSSHRMNDIIKNLLDLSHLGSSSLKMVEIDLNKMVHATIDEVKRDLHIQNVTIDVKPLDSCYADQGLLQLVLNNLIGNAIKYSSKSPQPKVEIECYKNEEGITVYEIKDNGAGFDNEMSRHIFKPFQRGHRKEEFEGVGIGLSIVDVVIKRHHGQVWAKGEVGVGATFFFTLPPKASN